MGNSNNSKIRQRADSVTIRYKEDTKEKKADAFSKSRSMVELGTKTRHKSTTGSVREKPKLSSRDSTKTQGSNGGISRTKSVRRDASHPISSQSREIIVQCFENPHSEFGNKVLQRIFEKRADFQNYVYQLGKERSYQMSVRLKELIEDVVAKIYDPDYISQVSRQYGEEHVDLKQFGWKPDFWVAIADAITVEGVILDMANHQPADTVAAWSSLVTLMFSSVRDGYYTALRKHRMSSRKCLRRQTTVESANSTIDVDVSVPPTPSPSSNEPPCLALPSSTAASSRRTSSQSVDSEGSNGVVRANIMAPVYREPPHMNGNIPSLVLSRNSIVSARPVFE